MGILGPDMLRTDPLTIFFGLFGVLFIISIFLQYTFYKALMAFSRAHPEEWKSVSGNKSVAWYVLTATSDFEYGILMPWPLGQATNSEIVTDRQFLFWKKWFRRCRMLLFVWLGIFVVCMYFLFA